MARQDEKKTPPRTPTQTVAEVDSGASIAKDVAKAAIFITASILRRMFLGF